MLKGNADQWNEPKGNNRKEDYKPWYPVKETNWKKPYGRNADKQKVKAASADGEPAE